MEKEIVERKDVPYVQAKKEISDYIQKNSPTDIGIIHEKLQLPVDQIVLIVEELESEGNVK